MSSINETLKQKIDEWDLDRRLNELVDSAEKVFHRAVETAAEVAHDRRDDVDRVLDTLSTKLDERTEGKYAERVDQVRGHVENGLDRLAEHRPDEPAPDQGPDES
jgi:ElaB/YqjD/DUF883 family membrane-anchored ribosome-binding protein